jgi:hypothetical protein
MSKLIIHVVQSSNIYIFGIIFFCCYLVLSTWCFRAHGYFSGQTLVIQEQILYEILVAFLCWSFYQFFGEGGLLSIFFLPGYLLFGY